MILLSHTQTKQSKGDKATIQECHIHLLRKPKSIVAYFAQPETNESKKQWEKGPVCDKEEVVENRY
jgi:hypothetical protein